MWFFVVCLEHNFGDLARREEIYPYSLSADQLLGSSMDSLMLLPVAHILKEGFLTHPVVQTNAGTLFWPEELLV